jgi:hypothetical protein
MMFAFIGGGGRGVALGWAGASALRRRGIRVARELRGCSSNRAGLRGDIHIGGGMRGVALGLGGPSALRCRGVCIARRLRVSVHMAPGCACIRILRGGMFASS